MGATTSDTKIGPLSSEGGPNNSQGIVTDLRL